QTKNARYNSKGPDLTTFRGDEDVFYENITPRGLPILPVEESVIVAVGKIVKIQPYLSDDRSQIYTELSMQVENLLKTDDSNANINSFVLDQVGGSIQLRSGHKIQYKVQIGGRGNPCENNRYVFFIQKADENNGYYFINGYELSEGKVFTLDTGKKKLITDKYAVSKEFADEKTFLELTRREIEKTKVK